MSNRRNLWSKATRSGDVEWVPPAASEISKEVAPSIPDELKHTAQRGDRYAIPRACFDIEGDDNEFLLAVVIERVRGSTRLWFERDLRSTLYKGGLEDWSEHFLIPEEYDPEDEARFQKLEERAGLRAPPQGDDSS